MLDQFWNLGIGIGEAASERGVELLGQLGGDGSAREREGGFEEGIMASRHRGIEASRGEKKALGIRH